MIILLKRDLEEDWIQNNPRLNKYELIVVYTEEGVKYKYGDGETHFIDLPYLKSLTDIDFFTVYCNDFKPITIFLNPTIYDEMQSNA